MPKFKKDNYHTWEYYYFPCLLDMYTIVYGSEFDVSTMNNFFNFLYSNSSKTISKYLEKMDQETQNIYNDFQIKRNELTIK